MRPEAYQALAERQETYWWHRARRTMALGLLRRFGLRSGCSWLDIGCGPGGNFSMLAPLEPRLVAGVDASPVALDLARTIAPSVELVQTDVNDGLPFAEGTFDAVTIFNVLYHGWVRSESDALAEAARVLRPGGLLLVTEPAFDMLKRGMDDVVMTRRRYRISDFDPWLRSAGFESLYASYFTSFGVPLLLAAKLLNGASRETAPGELAADMRPLPGAVNAIFLTLARIEALALTRGMRMPFGTTLVLVARRLP